MTDAFRKELEVARRLAREAGALILEVGRRGYAVEEKPAGGGPVTEADLRANDLIERGLREAFPGDGVVTEESRARDEGAARCWYVDPLDGTKEFIRGNGQFAVHIGLAVEGRARLGVVYQPASDRLWAGVVGGPCFLEEGGERRTVHVSAADPSSIVLAVSRSHPMRRLDLLASELGIEKVVRYGSVGLKCAMVAEGAAHLYVHPSARSYRWDACAPEAVVRAAGGVLVDLAGNPYRYGEGELQNRRGILVCSRELLPAVLPVAERIGRESGLLG
ncbi:MAG: 3'(2'),5'-bisphosphate nucleotidase CysQ [Pseudomonadota bacterium]|nr:MAG: 3'(2'),5'-bisphosphate nucleotidase CysQ [Pseudomonadota bacterium]